MNLGGMEAIAQEVAGKAILDHAQETERKLVSCCLCRNKTNKEPNEVRDVLLFVVLILHLSNQIIPDWRGQPSGTTSDPVCVMATAVGLQRRPQVTCGSCPPLLWSAPMSCMYPCQPQKDVVVTACHPLDGWVNGSIIELYVPRHHWRSARAYHPHPDSTIDIILSNIISLLLYV